jgi:hypothetical protein
VSTAGEYCLLEGLASETKSAMPLQIAKRLAETSHIAGTFRMSGVAQPDARSRYMNMLSKVLDMRASNSEGRWRPFLLACSLLSVPCITSRPSQ